MDTGARLAIFAIVENNQVMLYKWRLGGILYVDGVKLIPSVSIKDRTIVGPCSRLNTASHIAGRIASFDRKAE